MIATKATCRHCGESIYRANSKKPWKHLFFTGCASVVFFGTYAEPEDESAG